MSVKNDDVSVSIPQLYLLRHGETDWNVAKRLQGHTDIPLNERGKQQACRHGDVLADVFGLVHTDAPKTPKNIDVSEWRFVSSPLGRCRETMEILRERMGLEREGYELSEQLLEIGFGRWEGNSWAELREQDPELVQARFDNPWAVAAPEGETYSELQGRVVSWYERLPEKTIAVTHSGPSRIIRGHVAQLGKEEITQQDSPQDAFLRVRPDGFEWV